MARVSIPQPFPPTLRLRRAADFRRLIEHGAVRPGRQCLVRRLAVEGTLPRLGIAVPRGYGGAVRRNRFRRLVREAFRSLAPRLAGVDLLVSPRRGLTEPTLEGLRADLARGLGLDGHGASPTAQHPAGSP